MGTTLDTYAPYDSGAGANSAEATWRRIFRRVISSGVLLGAGDNFEVYADSSGPQIKVRTGECWIAGHWGESTSEKILPIGANALGLTRGDRVVLRNDFLANIIELDVLKGTTGTAPAVTQNTNMWEISLATLAIPNAFATVATGAVTDDRVWGNSPHENRLVAGRTIAAVGAVHSNIVGTEINVAKLAVASVPVFTGRYYELLVDLFANMGTAGDSWTVRVRKDTALSGTIVAEWPFIAGSTGFDDTKSFTRVWKCLATNNTQAFYVSVVRVAGSSNLDVYGDKATHFRIKDAGNIANWTEVA